MGHEVLCLQACKIELLWVGYGRSEEGVRGQSVRAALDRLQACSLLLLLGTEFEVEEKEGSEERIIGFVSLMSGDARAAYFEFV